MGRPHRLNAPGALYHLTARGNRKQPIFTDPRDRQRFFELVARQVLQLGWRCHSYCLMTNHYHLLIETPHGDLSRGMHHLNGVYAKWFNWRHNFEGHLFERRFHDVVVEGQAHLLELTRYIVLNPVRAGIAAHPSDWEWSSYADLAQGRPRRPFLTIEMLLGLFSNDRARASGLYCDFVADGIRAAAISGPVPVPGTKRAVSRSRRRLRSAPPAGSRGARPAGRRR